MEIVESTQIKYPEIRENLKFYTRELASDDIKKLWSNSEGTKNRSANIEYIINFFFDDTSFSTDASGYIGLALMDDGEVKAVDKLVFDLNSIFDRYGTELSDKEYINTPEWENVNRSAIDLLLILEK